MIMSMTAPCKLVKDYMYRLRNHRNFRKKSYQNVSKLKITFRKGDEQG